MPKVTENEVYSELLRYAGEGKVRIRDADVRLRLAPVDVHSEDCPDCILWVECSFRLFGQDVELRVPIPIEAEKGGIYAGALEDLEKFAGRQRYPIEMPMIVVAETGYATKEELREFPVRFTVSQVPIRVVNQK